MGGKREYYPRYKAKKRWGTDEDGKPVYLGTQIYEKRGKGKQWDALFLVKDFEEARVRVEEMNDAVVNQLLGIKG